MIFIRVHFLNEFNTLVSGVLEVSRETTIAQLSALGYVRIELL